jgi:CheY-like chemotaxis protein
LELRAVLVVDDSAGSRRLARLALAPAGLEVAEASSGREGLDRVAEEPRPVLVLLSVALPDMEGWDALYAIRSLAATRDLPVILGAEEARDHDEARARMAGASAYVAKPYDTDRLRDLVLDVLGR